MLALTHALGPSIIQLGGKTPACSNAGDGDSGAVGAAVHGIAFWGELASILWLFSLVLIFAGLIGLALATPG